MGFEERQNFAKPIEIIQEPTVSKCKPVKSKKLLNSAIAGILVLFVLFSGLSSKNISQVKRKNRSQASIRFGHLAYDLEVLDAIKKIEKISESNGLEYKIGEVK